MSDSLSPYQLLARASTVTGKKYRLRPWDEVTKVVISADKVGITVKRWKVTELARSTRLTDPSLVMVVWTYQPITDSWTQDEASFPLDTLEVTVHEFQTRSDFEVLQRQVWEKLDGSYYQSFADSVNYVPTSETS